MKIKTDEQITKLSAAALVDALVITTQEVNAIMGFIFDITRIGKFDYDVLSAAGESLTESDRAELVKLMRMHAGNLYKMADAIEAVQRTDSEREAGCIQKICNECRDREHFIDEMANKYIEEIEE